jgi:ubiquinol-cytochrome c reductase cytochrome c1 subunit
MTFPLSRTTAKAVAKPLAIGALALVLTSFAFGASAGPSAEEPHAPPGGFSFEGPFGTFNQGQLQRGFKVWKEVCSNCHSMKLVAIGDLGRPGGPFFNPKYANANDNPVIKAIAADYKVPDIDTQTGDPIQRPATPADTFPPPWPNSVAAAAANGGAIPPDHSTIAKAREGGARYIYSLLTGYVSNPPAGLKVGDTQNYNPYMAGDMTSFWSGKGPPPKGGFIAMAPPLIDDRVTYDDGTKATLSQEAADVAAFLEWASDPHAIERKRIGLGVLIFLGIFAVLTYLSYRAIWRGVSH